MMPSIRSSGSQGPSTSPDKWNGTRLCKKKKKMYVNAKQMDGLNHEDHSPSTKVGKEGRDLRI